MCFRPAGSQGCTSMPLASYERWSLKKTSLLSKQSQRSGNGAAMGLVPDEAKVLPPPGIVNRSSVWLGFIGWSAAMIQNAINHRPALRAGVHRQVLFSTVGWFIGYHLTKYENYVYAKLDRDMNEYIRLHPEDFAKKEPKTFAEIVEPFHPVR